MKREITQRLQMIEGASAKERDDEKRAEEQESFERAKAAARKKIMEEFGG
jgi:hypothetical protein